jgi:5S rRNA maturation endonuclease (ribonuclease M5)
MHPKGRLGGSSDPNKRFMVAGQSIAEERRRNREFNCPVLVEGKRDKIALESLGFTGKIEVLNRGWSIERVVTYLFETYGTRNQIDDSTVISVLMDWDRTGGRLQRKILELLESFDMKVSQETRNVLMKALKPETRVVESLKGLSYALLPYISDFDFQN